MAKRKSAPFLFEPDDSVEVVEQKLRERFGEEPRLVQSGNTIRVDGPVVGRPYADWRIDAYERFRVLRAEGKPEKVAVAQVASQFKKTDDAVKKAMRIYDDAATDDFWTELMRNDPKKAAKEFCALDPHIRLRLAKQLRRFRK